VGITTSHSMLSGYTETPANGRRRLLALVADLAAESGAGCYRFSAGRNGYSATALADHLETLARVGLCERESLTQWAFAVGGDRVLLVVAPPAAS
jgi:hypothetical protein